MAESYRGLTIRIGGDTTKLSQALHTANQAISGTQSGLKKLNDALKMDPTSIKAAQLQVGAFAEQASNAATRLIDLNRAMQQVGDKIPEGATQSIREMAAGWENVQMKAAQARDYYNDLTKTLATSYTEMSKLSAEAAKLESKKLGSDWTITTNVEQMVQDMQAVPASFQASESAVEAFKKKVENLQESYQTLSYSVQSYEEAFNKARSDTSRAELSQKIVKARQEMEKLQESFVKARDSFTTLSGVTFKFDKNNVDMESIIDGLKDIVAAGAASEEQAGKMIADFDAMKAAWIDAKQELNVANEVAQYADLEAEAAKAEAKVKSLVDEMERLAKTSTVAKGMVDLEQKLGEITQRGSEAKQSLENVLQALSRSDGGNNQAIQTEAYKAYSDAVTAVQQKIELLQQQIAKYDDSEVIALSQSMRYLNEGLTESTAEWRNQATAVQTYQAMLNDVTERMNDIRGKQPDAYEDSEEYQELYAQSLLLAEGMTKVKESEAAAKEEMDKFVQATELRDKVRDLELAKDAAKQLADINIKPEVDLSAVDGLKKALEAISNSTFNGDGLSKFKEGVKQASDALSDAEKRYKSLSEAAKKDPTNSETLRMRTAAFDEVVQATVAHIDAMKAELAAIPSDRVDQAALAAGKAEENYRQAKEEVERWKDSLIDVNKRIDELTKERDSIKVVTPEDKQRVDELNQSLDELKQRRAAIAATGDAAFDNLAVAENTRQVQEHSVAIQQDEARLHELGEEARNVGSTDATPKIDEAAFMQVVDRVAQAARQMASEIVQASNEVDSAYRDMRKTVNGSEEDFERLKDAAIEYSKSSFTSADQMLEMQALGGQLGVAVENLQKFGEISSNLDIATDIDAETVALKLGQISNVLGLDIDGMQGFADALVRLGNNMPAQESAIMNVAQRFGAVAATAKFSGDEVLAWSAAIAATGQRSEAAATAISNTVSGIEQAVANGGSDLKQFAAIAGMSSEEFVSAWKDSPTEVLRAFIEGLKTLKDNNVSAVAALENMGITGVRQQQTLLALTQTIDNLDDALLMSKDAWNGVNDQWGQSGDAANEAQKKAEGFSGALQILKNNVQNLAASLGDGMVRPMQIIADAIGYVTDVLNNLPQPVKEIIVTLGAAGIAFSAVTPMLNVFAKGMTKMVETASSASTIGEFIAKLTGFDKVGAAFTAATEGATGFAAVLSGPMVLGIGAVAIGLAALYSYLVDFQEKQDMLTTATTGLVTSVNNMKAAYESYIPESAIQSVSELRDRTDEVIEAQASLAENMGSKWEEVGVQAAMVDEFASKIAELTEKQSLNAEEQAELIAAVQSYNDLTGSTVQVVDAVTGKLDTSTQSILENADAWKKRAESEAAFEMYKDVVKQRIKDELALAEADRTVEAAEEDAKNATMDLYGGFSTANIEVAKAKEEQNRLREALDATKQTEKDLIGHMADSERAIQEVRDALIKAGVATTEFDSLTRDMQVKVAAAFNGTADSAIAAIDRIKAAAAGEAAGISESLEEASKEAAKQRYNEAKDQYDEEYKAAKRSADAAYKSQQRAFDAAYKQQQRAYDSEYKSLKSKLDKQYNARKTAYDHEYDALKRKLDGEERALKQSNDAKLTALKNQNDAEEREFKAATDAYLHELEKRYKAAVKEAEDETDARVKAIDEQIRALKAQTTAEQNAVKEMKEDDKLATLQKDIDNAKSRRKREEAEKKYNMYLAEVTADRNERERKDQISALELEKSNLKDALSTRKEDLKTAYDEEKYLYKLSRDEMLEDLKLANDAEYDALKLKLDNEAQLQKDHNDIVLAQLKEQQEAQLDALKEEHQAKLDALKADQTAQLDAMKADQTAQLDAMKASQDAALEAMKKRQEAELEIIKDGGKVISAEEQAQYDSFVQNAQKMVKATETKGTAMVGQIRGKFNEMFGIADKKGGEMESATSKHFGNMEKNAGESSQNTVKAVDSANDTMTDNSDKKLKELADMYKTGGDESTAKLAGAFEEGQQFVDKNAQMLANTAVSPFGGLPSDMYTNGWDMLVEFHTGLVRAWNEDGLAGTIDYIAQYIKDRWGFSVPKYGPMSDADKWGPDMVYLIADGIKDKQHVLIRQIEKMSDAMEEAFDPTLSVDAAYEALDTIGKKRTASLGAIVETNSAPSVNITLNMNLADVSIRNDGDIERLARVMSQEMATQAARQLAGRLG